MKKITVLLVLLFTTLSFAQQGINYKAVIKDGGGNVIASTPITVEFTIYEGAGETTIAYQETHTPTTDSNGIIILNIGEGAVDSGVFANIDWAADDHYLNTQIDTGSGLTDMGTTQFMAVPYAKLAEKVSVEDDPKVGVLAAGYLPRWNGTVLEDGSIYNIGTNVGIGTNTPTDRLVVSGGRVEMTATTDASELPGTGVLEIANSLRIDGNEIITNVNADLFLNNNNNGDVIIDNNTFRVDASANKVGIGTATPGTIITNSKLDVVGGHIAVSNNFGVLSFNTTSDGIGAGFDTTPSDDLHLYAGGTKQITVNKNGAVAIGTSTAILEHSTAIGYLAVAEGKHSVAIGRSTNAVRDGSLSTGWFTRANGIYSTAMGFNTIAESYISTAIGRYNVGNGFWGSWNSGDPLFEIGIGSSAADKKNAMTVLKNGSVGIGTANPVFPLHVTTRNSGVGDASPNHYLANGGVGINGTGWTYSIGATYGIWSGVGFAVSSDSRIKNIIGQSNSADDLSKLMQLEVTDYQFIDIVNKGNDVTKKVIAQQVKEVLPSAVNYTTDFIPNVYAMANVSVVNGTTLTLTLNETPDVKVGDIIKVVPKDATELQTKVLAIDGNSLEVSITNAQDLGDQLFVFGKQVNDFHTVDYDAISMLNVSATQAQQKLIENLQNEVGELKQVITEYKSIEQRLSLLETANSNAEGATVEK